MSWSSHRNRAVGAALAAIAGLWVLAGCSSGNDPAGGNSPVALASVSPGSQVMPTGIAAHGVGKAEGTPDVLTLQLGVQTRAAKAADALTEDNRSAQALIDLLKGKGVAARDIQTSGLSINPDFDQAGRITGYSVANMVTVRLRDLTGAGALIDAAAQAVGDAIRVQGIAFSIDDTGAEMAKARKDAVAQAVAQAKQLADAAGVRLGKVRSITESTSILQPQPLASGQAMGAARAVPIEPGTQTMTVSVDVVYDIAS